MTKTSNFCTTPPPLNAISASVPLPYRPFILAQSLILCSFALMVSFSSHANAQGRSYTEPGDYNYQEPRASRNNNASSYNAPYNNNNNNNNNNNTPSYSNNQNNRQNDRNSANRSNNEYYGIPQQGSSAQRSQNNTDNGYKPNYNQPPVQVDKYRSQGRDYTNQDRDDGNQNQDNRAPHYNSPRPPYRDQQQPPFKQPRLAQGYTEGEIKSAGHRFFGNITTGLAKVITKAFRRNGRPNAYILGEEGGGAFIAGLRYGEGKLYTKSLGQHPIFWQGPSIGYDFGASGSKSMTLIYNLKNIDFIYQKFGGVSGSAYAIGGVGITLMKRDDVTVAPIRAGVGLRLGASIGYLKFTRRPTWNPF